MNACPVCRGGATIVDEFARLQLRVEVTRTPADPTSYVAAPLRCTRGCGATYWWRYTAPRRHLRAVPS